MHKNLYITAEDIVKILKMSCHMSEIIEDIIVQEIIVQTAKKLGIKVKSEELQKAADNFRLTQKLQSAEITLVWLKQNYLSLDDFQELIYLNVISNKLCEYLFSDRVKSHYLKHQIEYASAGLSEIILTDRDLGLKLFYAIRQGKLSFADVADRYIEDPQLKRMKGYLGIVKYNDLQPEIATAVFAATPPHVIRPIFSSGKVHLIKVEEIIQPQFNEKLRYKIILDLYSEWLKQKIKEYSITLDWQGQEILEHCFELRN